MSTSILSRPELIWFIIGLILFLLELVLPGFVIFFFGVGAWITALLCLIAEPGINLQAIVFAVTSVLSLVLLRKMLQKRFFYSREELSKEVEDEFTGREAVAIEDIIPGENGKVEFKGTSWKAESESAISRGQTVIIKNKENFKLIVEPKKIAIMKLLITMAASSSTTFILIGIILLAFILISSMVKVVPQRSAIIVERLGKYRATFTAGFQILIPFFDKIRYRHTLKEQAIDVAPQICITRDNIAVEVDGIDYLQVLDPQKASYGIDNYRFASIQIAQTTMRSVIGKLELDKTFEERESINATIVEAVDKASEPWGVKVTRYEVKNITPPQSIRDAMEKQMRAEREKRAIIAESEGTRQAKINVADGDKQEFILKSEGEKQRRINEAAGKASEIEQVATATSNGIRSIAKAISEENGLNAVNLRIAEQYLLGFANLAKQNNTIILPSNLTDIAGIVATATSMFNEVKDKKK
jgi:regulator of protease activity HflC (stomatin/prohibitin superfamily)/membrane protein implicated in regulation of membrane protease activity